MNNFTILVKLFYTCNKIMYNKLNIILLGLFILFSNLIGSCSNSNSNNYDKEEKLFKNNKPICQVLSFSGGGSFGAVEVGILSQIALDNYDMITGVSAGGLNAGFLSYFNIDLSKSNTTKPNYTLSDGIDNLAGIYFNLKNSDVYTHNFAQIHSTWSYYDTIPLRKTITKEIEKLFRFNLTNPNPTLIGSTNLNQGNLEIFRFDLENKKNQVDILMATSAIPLIFPPIHFGSNLYTDGGTVANEIINGIEGYIGCDKYNITFITASEKINSIESINTFDDYVQRVIQVVITDFDDELAEIIDNPCVNENMNMNKIVNNKGWINYCYPVSSTLSNYSILDFEHGKELYEIGKNNYVCEQYNYC